MFCEGTNSEASPKSHTSRVIKKSIMNRSSKKILFLSLSLAIFSSCNNGDGSTKPSSGKDSLAVAPVEQKMSYPYSIEYPDNWEIGNQQNTFNALSALKAWENGNIDESLKFFADSVLVQFDGIDKKVSRDTLKAIITPAKMVKGVKVKMQDWESVVSKDKKDEYVTLWYRQYYEMVNGKTDSVDVINDIKMKDGKIVGLDEYRRKLHL